MYSNIKKHSNFDLRKSDKMFQYLESLLILYMIFILIENSGKMYIYDYTFTSSYSIISDRFFICFSYTIFFDFKFSQINLNCQS